MAITWTKARNRELKWLLTRKKDPLTMREVAKKFGTTYGAIKKQKSRLKRTVWAKLCIVVTVLLLAAATVRADEQPKSSAEVWGNTGGIEARFLLLGGKGGAAGVYAGLADELIKTDDEVVRFGVLGRYNVIADGSAPVGDWLPDALRWFTDLLGLPSTTPADMYVGMAVGAIYRTDEDDENGDFEYEVGPLIGMRVGPIAGEFGYLLDDGIIKGLPDQRELERNLVWRVGIVFQF